MRDVTVIVDQHNNFFEAFRLGQRIDALWESREIKQMVRVLGAADELIALVFMHDEHGLEAYFASGYDVVPMAKERDNELGQFIRDTSKKLLADPPKHLVVVTRDKELKYLLSQVKQNEGVSIEVWVPGNTIPKVFSDPGYNSRLLKELLGQPQAARVDTRIDFENLYIGLAKKGITLKPKALIETIEAQLDDLGDIVNIVAYADWRALYNRAGRDLQRSLTRIGVDTRNLINVNGKNSADMKIADDIRGLMELKPTNPRAVNAIVLVTNDKDFRPLLHTARRWGQKIVILALKGGPGKELKRAAKGDIRYLDPTQRHRRKKQNYSRRSELSEAWPTDPHAELILRVATWMHQHNKPWATPREISDGLKLGAAGRASLDKAIDDGLFQRHTRNQRVIVALNQDHQLALISTLLSKWLPQYLSNRFKTSNEPFIDTTALVETIASDWRCNKAGLGPNPNQVEAWLDQVASAELLAKRLEPVAGSPGEYTGTWWLPLPYQGAQRVQ